MKGDVICPRSSLNGAVRVMTLWCRDHLIACYRQQSRLMGTTAKVPLQLSEVQFPTQFIYLFKHQQVRNEFP